MPTGLIYVFTYSFLNGLYFLPLLKTPKLNVANIRQALCLAL